MQKYFPNIQPTLQIVPCDILHLNIRKRVSVLRRWLPLEILQSHLDVSLSKQLWVALLEEGVGPGGLQKPLLTSVSLRFCDLSPPLGRPQHAGRTGSKASRTTFYWFTKRDLGEGELLTASVQEPPLWITLTCRLSSCPLRDAGSGSPPVPRSCTGFHLSGTEGRKMVSYSLLDFLAPN